ncbi:hypothetical protein AOLI_G00303950 [Acnodon oligacanthus]
MSKSVIDYKGSRVFKRTKCGCPLILWWSKPPRRIFVLCNLMMAPGLLRWFHARPDLDLHHSSFLLKHEAFSVTSQVCQESQPGFQMLS